MISSRFGTGNEKDESGLSCYIREKEIIKVYLLKWYQKETDQLENAPTGQRWNYLNIKKNKKIATYQLCQNPWSQNGTWKWKISLNIARVYSEKIVNESR